MLELVIENDGWYGAFFRKVELDPIAMGGTLSVDSVALVPCSIEVSNCASSATPIFYTLNAF